MKVVYIITSAVSISLMEGQLDYLKKAGYRVIVVASPLAKADMGDVNMEEINAGAWDYVPIQMTRGVSPIKDLISLLRLYRLLKGIRPELVNVSTPKAGLLGGIAALLAKVPCRIYTLRGLRLETTSGFKRSYLLLCEKIAAFCSHRVVCVSESLMARVKEMGIASGDKMLVLGNGSSNGVNINRFKNARGLRKQLGIEEDEAVIGFVGRITVDKGICDLLEAFDIITKKIKKVKLLLVGRFEDPVSERVKSMIKENKGIIWTGHVNDTAPYYKTMDVMSIPSYREGFSNVVLEAGAAGIPVVGADSTGVTDGIVHGKTGFLCPKGNVESIVENLVRILGDKKLAKRLGASAQEHVVKYFTQEQLWGRIDKFYQELVKERGIGD